MAEEEKQEEQKTKDDDKKTAAPGMIQWIITAAIVLVCAGAGAGLSKLMARSPQQPQDTKPNTQKKTEDQTENEEKTKNIWYYRELPSVVANLDEPGATRFIRTTLTFEMNTPEKQKDKIFARLEEKKPILTNWLTIYLGGLRIQECTGRNKRSIQAQILDAFNEELFPDSKPLIKKILLTEFVIN